MTRYLDPDCHRQWISAAYEGLWSYCPKCAQPLVVSMANWEPIVSSFLCLRALTTARHGARPKTTWCQTPVVILWDQVAAEAAQAIGGMSAVMAIGEAQWKMRRAQPTS